MEIKTRIVDDEVIIELKGSLLTHEEGVQVVESIQDFIRQGYRRFALDLEGVKEVDSAGLGQIVRMEALIRRQGGALRVVKPSERVLDLLTITKIQTLFEGEGPGGPSHQGLRAAFTDSTMRSFLFWIVLVIGGVLIWNFSTTSRPRPAASMGARYDRTLSDDQLCELWVGHRLREVTDAWQGQYRVIVRCTSAPQAREGEISVTVTRANAAEAVAPAQKAGSASDLKAVLERLVASQGWEKRYPKRDIHYTQ